jgi:hypothetical protein
VAQFQDEGVLMDILLVFGEDLTTPELNATDKAKHRDTKLMTAHLPVMAQAALRFKSSLHVFPHRCG